MGKNIYGGIGVSKIISVIQVESLIRVALPTSFFWLVVLTTVLETFKANSPFKRFGLRIQPSFRHRGILIL